MKKVRKVALIVGHIKEKAEGAFNIVTGITEWQFNNNLAAAISLIYDTPGVSLHVFHRPEKYGLYAVAEAVNQYDPDFAVSMHANAAIQSVSGAEVLYWHNSNIGKKVAEYGAELFASALGIPNRGAKPRKKGDRGSYILRRVRAPIVLCEPFFISNPDDLRKAYYNYRELVGAYISLINYALNLIETGGNN